MKLYKFYKEGCAPCYSLSRILTRVSIPEDIEIISKNLSLEENKEFAKENGITKVPVLMFENGNKLEGANPLSLVSEFLINKGVKNAISN